jgi:hypothetical protein
MRWTKAIVETDKTSIVLQGLSNFKVRTDQPPSPETSMILKTPERV